MSKSIHSPLRKEDLKENPMDLFKIWFNEANNYINPSSNILALSSKDSASAMTLSTIGIDGIPSSRTVFMKKIIPEGFVFFTNYESKKSQDIKFNPIASALFFWKELGKQVQIIGSVKKTSKQISDDYFSSRDYLSKIGAWTSKQSSELDNRSVLEEKKSCFCKKYPDNYANSVPRPNFWGGYVIEPQKIEFWKSRENRLHDRFLYIKKIDSWHISRLSP